MVLWKRKTPAATHQRDPPAPPPLARLPEHGEPGMLFPRRDARGRFFRHDCVDRSMACLHGPLNRADRLHWRVAVQPCDGNITLNMAAMKRENVNDEQEQGNPDTGRER